MILKKHARKTARAAAQARAKSRAQTCGHEGEIARLKAIVTVLLEGVCPCHSDLDDPGPDHADWCKWSDPEYDGSGVCCGEAAP